MTRVSFDLPPIEDLAPRLRVMAAVSNVPVTFALPPDYLRQIAARLDRVAALEAQSAGLAADLAEARGSLGFARAQLAGAVDAQIKISNSYVRLLIWNICLGTVIFVGAGVARLAGWL